MAQDLKTTIGDLIGATASEAGYVIYDYTVILKGENSKISVKIDRIEGISHGDCEIYSRELSRRLDQEKMLPNYSLEVSSPGIKRNVRNIEEFIRFKGSPVKVVYEDEKGRFAVKGIISDVQGECIVLISDGQEHKLQYSGIKSANLEL